MNSVNKSQKYMTLGILYNIHGMRKRKKTFEFLYILEVFSDLHSYIPHCRVFRMPSYRKSAIKLSL